MGDDCTTSGAREARPTKATKTEHSSTEASTNSESLTRTLALARARQLSAKALRRGRHLRRKTNEVRGQVFWRVGLSSENRGAVTRFLPTVPNIPDRSSNLVRRGRRAGWGNGGVVREAYAGVPQRQSWGKKRWLRFSIIDQCTQGKEWQACLEPCGHCGSGENWIQNDRDRLNLDAYGSLWRCSCACAFENGAMHPHRVVLLLPALVDVLPDELTLGLTASSNVIAHLDGQGSRSKTGDTNVGVFLDSTWISWINPLLCQLQRGHPMDAAWSVRYLHESKAFAGALENPALSPYEAQRSLRRASRQYAHRRRSMEATPVEFKTQPRPSELSLYSTAVVTFMRCHCETGLVTSGSSLLPCWKNKLSALCRKIPPRWTALSVVVTAARTSALLGRFEGGEKTLFSSDYRAKRLSMWACVDWLTKLRDQWEHLGSCTRRRVFLRLVGLSATQLVLSARRWWKRQAVHWEFLPDGPGVSHWEL